MSGTGSIFFQFNLPNAATWFYFSLLLSIALFFKFSRLLSIRNLDILGLFLLVPGLLLLQEAHARVPTAGPNSALGVARLVLETSQVAGVPGLGLSNIGDMAEGALAATAPPPRVFWYAYLWLIGGSVLF